MEGRSSRQEGRLTLRGGGVMTEMMMTTMVRVNM